MIKFQKIQEGKIMIEIPFKTKNVVIEKIISTSSFNLISSEKVQKSCFICLEQSQNASISFEQLEKKLKEIYKN